MGIPLPVRMVPSLALRAWFTPPPLGSRARQRDVDAIRGFSLFGVDGHTGFEVGAGPLVLAFHGWGGRAAQMAPIARHLAAAGFRVVALNHPGGAGKSPTDIKKVAKAWDSLIETTGPPHAVIAHSFAAMVMRLVFTDEAPPAVVLIAPSLRVSDALEVFSDRARLFSWARRGLRAGLETWDPDLWPVVSQLGPEQLPGSDLLILHDPDDEDTPFEASAILAALRPNTDLVPNRGSGHAGILTDPTTLDLVSDFLVGRITESTPAQQSSLIADRLAG
ncbi:MAG: alpha/beta hydrolase [Acidimicrobiia bacterium]